MSTFGEYRYPDESVYVGHWDAEGRRHGYGMLTLSDGSKFKGNFHHGMYDELGVIEFSDGTRYEGEFKQGKFDGHGMFTRADRMRYEGEFQDGKIWGLGIVTFQDGTHGLPRMEGYFEGTKLVRQEKCQKSLQRARDAANRARAFKGREPPGSNKN